MNDCVRTKLTTQVLNLQREQPTKISFSLRLHACVWVRIQERHAVFRNEKRSVTLTPLSGSKVIVNGNAVYQTTDLQHLVGLCTVQLENMTII